MKSKIIGIVTFFIFSVSLSGQAMDNPDQDELKKQFQNRTEEWKNAYNSKDAQNLVAHYSADAQYISSHVNGLVADGRDKLIANFQNGMNMGGHIDSVEILTMNVSCDLATLLCKYTATNNGVTVVGRNLLVMKKISGTWVISLHMTVV